MYKNDFLFCTQLDSLPPPDVLVAEIAEDLEAALTESLASTAEPE